MKRAPLAIFSYTRGCVHRSARPPFQTQEGDMTLDFDKSDMGQDWGNQDYEDISSDIGSSASMASSGDDCDDADYTTMAKFVPTLLLERLRTVGEATMTRRSSLGMDSESGATDGTNFPKVRCTRVEIDCLH